MVQSRKFSRPPTDRWNLINSFVEPFEAACNQSDSVDLTAYLPSPGHALRGDVLRELIKIDLEVAWRNNRGAPLEEYLRRFPELGALARLPADLIYEEYRIRQLHGDRPGLELYRQRFPEQFDELKHLLAQEPVPPPLEATRLPLPDRTPPQDELAPTVNAPLPGSAVPSDSPTLPPSRRQTLPQRVNGYTLLRQLGKGAFGEVWEALAPGGVEVAVKIIRGAPGDDETRNELRALDIIRTLRHPCLMPMHAYWVQEDGIYVAMGLAGGSLKDREKECKKQGLPGIPLDELLRYMREAAEGLDFANGKGVMHRDIKPDNILLQEGHALVADFGLARFSADHRTLCNVSLGGTPMFMAPEVFAGKVSPRTDQYSLAATYVQLRLGRPLFPSRDFPTLMQDHLHRQPDLAPLLEAEQQVLRRALAKEPAARFPSCREFVQALEAALAPPPKQAPEAADTRPGAGYRLVQRLGKGSFGEVWKADAPGGVPVAVKVVSRPIDHEEAQNELKALELIKHLNHPFLLQTHAFWTQDDRLYVAMELADCSLKDLDRKYRKEGKPSIPAGELLTYFEQAATALDYLHAEGVLHRDIKPENLLLLRGYAKVADLGLARMRQQRTLASATGCGTPVYMAPEVWRDQVSVHSDQYSLAASYAELRLGRRLFESASSLVALMEAHVGSTPDLSPLPEAEQQVLLRALAKEPGQRYASCVEFIQALREAVEPPPVVKLPSRRRLVALLALVLLPIGGLIAWGVQHVFFPPPPPTEPELPLVALPLGYEAEPNAGEAIINGVRYPKEIAYVLSDQTRIPFLLIPRRPGTNDPLSFYIMRDKVSVGLFQKFAKAQKPKDLEVQHKEWEKGAVGNGDFLHNRDPLHPVMAVHVEDAHRFARWLGGKLPSTRQWDKAAGRFEDNPLAGPYDPNWDPAKDKDRTQIALNRPQGPLPVGTASKDRSPFGCRDMAGNGFEWTRNLAAPAGQEVPSPGVNEETRVLLRGQTYQPSEDEPAGYPPFRFSALKPEPSGSYTRPQADIGFRVVLEP